MLSAAEYLKIFLIDNFYVLIVINIVVGTLLELLNNIFDDILCPLIKIDNPNKKYATKKVKYGRILYSILKILFLFLCTYIIIYILHKYNHIKI